MGHNAGLHHRKKKADSARRRAMMPRFSIMKKFVLAFLALSIAPLCALGISTLYSFVTIRERAIDTSTGQLENRAREALELRAVELAHRVTQFLYACEADLLTLKMLPPEAEAYRRFSLNHRKSVWTREGTDQLPVETHKEFPLYRELAFIGSDGRETVRIVGDRIIGSSEMRDVSKPENTSFGSEHYFQETLNLKSGEVYVSHVTGWYVTRKEQLGKAERIEDAVEGKKFDGVIRFATPCLGENGEFHGIAVLSLDHRHLMEFTLHVLPTDERFAVFPSYASGNYAFMFDDEGWMISHPKFYNIRGILSDGSQFDPAAPSYARERLLAGEVPFNLDYVGFINPNYPLIAREVRAGRSGVTSTFNVDGTPRIVAYAPISYFRPPYSKYGIFGGVTIGVEIATFQGPAMLASAGIDKIVAQTKENSLIIIGCSALVAVLLAVGLARQFTRPILHLSRKAQEIGAGEIPQDVSVHTGDELEVLAENFGKMARQIRKHQKNLEESLAELAESKKSVELHTKELEKQLTVLNNLHFLSRYLGSFYDRELVLRRVLKTCVEGLGYDRAMLYLYDSSARRLICNQAFGFSDDLQEKIMGIAYDVDHHDCTPTKVFLSGETIFVSDIRADQRLTAIDLRMAEDGETDSFVFTPVKSRDKVIGVLGADTKTSRREISRIDVEGLEILANDAARAIERSELYGKLVAERNFVQSIVNSMASGIIALDETGKVAWLNPYGETVFNITLEDAQGKHYRDVFAAYPSWITLIERCLSLPENNRLIAEHHSIIQQGIEKILEVHSSKVDRSQQGDQMFLIFVLDVTKRTLMEEHLRRSDRLISLGSLAAGIAHEIRNPLTGISLLMDDLHDHLRDRPEEQDLIRRSLAEMDRLENLINGLLDFAVPSRRANLEVRPPDGVLENTLFLVRKLCNTSEIALSVNSDGPFPLIKLDPERLQQALLNLILNAIQAMPSGGSLEVAVRNVTAEESLLGKPAVRISVTDTGTGIASEDIPYIFDPFFTRNPSGCGLGLAIVHSIVEEHMGRISVTSQMGGHTTFCVDLPTVDGHPAAFVERTQEESLQGLSERDDSGQESSGAHRNE
jgi:PAS domain S-box-containing protein